MADPKKKKIRLTPRHPSVTGVHKTGAALVKYIKTFDRKRNLKRGTVYIIDNEEFAI